MPGDATDMPREACMGHVRGQRSTEIYINFTLQITGMVNLSESMYILNCCKW